MRGSLLFLLVVFFGTANGQWVKSDSLHLTQQVSCLCGDLQNQLYVGQVDGSISKVVISENLEIETSFSFPNLSQVSAIICANPLKIFGFYQDNQSYIFLERFQSQPRTYDIKTPNGNRTDFVTMAMDQSIWMISQPDLTLIRYSELSTTPLYHLAALVEKEETVKMLSTVLNQIIIITNENIHFFNIAGQNTGKMTIPDLNNIVVWKGTVQGILKDRLYEVDMDSKKIEVMELPDDLLVESAIRLTQNNILLINSYEIASYQKR